MQLGCPPLNPWGASEVALSRAYFPRDGVVGPKRRGPVPNPGPRRSLLCVERGVRARSSSNSSSVMDSVPSRPRIAAIDVSGTSLSSPPGSFLLHYELADDVAGERHMAFSCRAWILAPTTTGKAQV
jgi:hypothetical protein